MEKFLITALTLPLLILNVALGQTCFYGKNDLIALSQTSRGQTTNVVFLPGGVEAVTGNGSTLDYSFCDHLGSAKVVMNNNNHTKTFFEYDPYGSINAGIAGPEEGNYTGTYKKELATQLYSSPARKYDPFAKRFLSCDILGTAIAPYSYVLGNPVNNIDPDGNITLSVTHQGQRVDFELHKTIAIENMNINMNGYNAFLSGVRQHISDQLALGIDMKLLQARLLFGGEATINSIYRDIGHRAKLVIPVVPETSEGIALGLYEGDEATAADLLEPFAQKTKASFYMEWGSQGYERQEFPDLASGFGSRLKSALETAVALKQKIHFNLDGLDLEYYHSAASAINETLAIFPDRYWHNSLFTRHGYTNVELYHVLNDPVYHSHTQFYKDGNPLSTEQVKSLGLEFRIP